MPSFFIDRPIFAWVVAIFIMIAGIIAIPLLPVSQYPDVAPPQISINTNYPGASSQDTYQSVTRLIEDELNGVEGCFTSNRRPAPPAQSRSTPPSSRAPIQARPRSTFRTGCSASNRACPIPSGSKACRWTRPAPASC